MNCLSSTPRRACWHALWGALWLVVASVAQAQPQPSPTELAAARQEFVHGVDAAREGRWEESLTSFERSYALFPHPQTLFNVAGARRRLGKLVASAEAYRKYLRSPPADTDPTSRAQAEAALAEIEPQLAQMTLSVEGMADGDEVELDGETLPHAALGAALPVDPGRHRITVHRDGVQIGLREIELVSGQQSLVALSVARVLPEPSKAPAAALAGDEDHDDRKGETPRKLRHQWWLWTAVGVVVAGAAVGTVLVLDRPRDRVSGDYEVSVP